MPKVRLDRSLRASVEVAAAPTDVWSVVSDVRRTGEWSPECSRVMCLGAVRRGAWMVGLNRRKRVRWPTLSRVISVDPGREIAWRTITNGAVWTYRLEPTGSGTRLAETRETPKGVSAFARGFTRVLLGGQRVHDDELEAGMQDGLTRIRSIAEA